MAIGIDRGMHKRLMDGLALLVETKEDKYWRDIISGLQHAYEDADRQLVLAKAYTLLYNELQVMVRSQVANELRARKRNRNAVQQ